MGTLAMIRRDTKTVTETIQPKDILGNQVLGSGGITGWQFWMTAKYDPGDPDSLAVFQKLPQAWPVTQAANTTTPAIACCILAPPALTGAPGHQAILAFELPAKD